MNDFSEIDKQYLKNRGIDLESVKAQYQLLKDGVVPIVLDRPATISDGVQVLSENQVYTYSKIYREYKNEYHIVKFVPASGVATRMFKDLFEFQNKFNPINQTFTEYVAQNKANSITDFFQNITHFAFYPLLKDFLEKINHLEQDVQKLKVAQYLLSEEGLNFSSYPKGLFIFHYVDNQFITPFQEHLIEAVSYAESNQQVRLHFTILPEHKKAFSEKLKEVCPFLEKKYKVKFKVYFSFQSPSTDTVSMVINSENQLYRDENEMIFLRPAGHGALLKNLNNSGGDLIFIKNIDNVSTEKELPITTLYKEALAGVLHQTKQRIHKILNKIEENQANINEILSLMAELQIDIPSQISPSDTDLFLTWVTSRLNRPIRVCGMVKNQGEAGGGPFWVKFKEGMSLQIVESSQIDINNIQQKQILEQSTHFNPVDLVCYIKDFKGNYFNLDDFSDKNQGFISEKVHKGERIKTLEISGLWNGSMAKWITIFVEVPIKTFNSVKTVNDLLKDAHKTY